MSKKVAYSGIFTACALIFSYIEYLIPINIGIPGIKLGLANIVIIVVLYVLGAQYAFMVNLVRIIIAALLFSGVYGMAFGLAGGMASLFIMALLKRTDAFSVTGVSIAGGTAHNIGQLFIAVVFIGNFAVFYYLPVLLISGALTGLCTGLLSRTLLNKLKLFRV